MALTEIQCLRWFPDYTYPRRCGKQINEICKIDYFYYTMKIQKASKEEVWSH